MQKGKREEVRLPRAVREDFEPVAPGSVREEVEMLCLGHCVGLFSEKEVIRRADELIAGCTTDAPDPALIRLSLHRLREHPEIRASFLPDRGVDLRHPIARLLRLLAEEIRKGRDADDVLEMVEALELWDYGEFDFSRLYSLEAQQGAGQTGIRERALVESGTRHKDHPESPLAAELELWGEKLDKSVG